MSYGQGGPQWSPNQSQWGQQAPGTSTPDWGQLAAESEQRRRRKRLLMIGGGALATLAIGTLVAVAIVQQGSGGDDDRGNQAGGSAGSSETGSPSTAPEPSFAETSVPPLPQPREFITDADKDTAPFTTESFYASETMTIGDREYTRVAVHETEDCADATTENLGAALAEHGCVALLRATYTDDAVAVTVGVAQFPGEEEAQAAREAAREADSPAHLSALTSGDAPEFCGRGGCRTTTNQVGRYTYFAIAGNADNSPDSGSDTPAQQAARDGNEHAHARIVQRGENQASASAEARVRERETGGSGEED